MTLLGHLSPQVCDPLVVSWRSGTNIRTANVALNALQLHSHDQAQFGISLYLHIPLNVTINIELDAGRQVKKSQASDHAHVSSSGKPILPLIS